MCLNTDNALLQISFVKVIKIFTIPTSFFIRMTGASSIGIFPLHLITVWYWIMYFLPTFKLIYAKATLFIAS